MRVELTRMRVESTRSTARQQCRALRDSTRIRVLVFLNSRSYVPATLVYVYIVIKLINTQHVKTTRTSVKITRISVKITLVRVKITLVCVWYSR
jgi:hypothetical protein